MLYYMNTKDFEDIFLENEDDNDILNAQYVVVSNRIRSGGRYENVISCRNILFPDDHIIMLYDKHDSSNFKHAYIRYVKKNHLPFLATLVRGSIKKNFNIIFICTKNEDKMKFLYYLSILVYDVFDYPMYNYKEYSEGKISLIEYDKEKVIKKCDKILEKASSKGYEKSLSSLDDKKKVVTFKYLKKHPKKLKTMLKDKNLYRKGMSIDEMMDMLESYYA